MRLWVIILIIGALENAASTMTKQARKQGRPTRDPRNDKAVDLVSRASLLFGAKFAN